MNESSLPHPPVQPRLRRDYENKMIGGVAAGMARHFDVDVSLVRLAFAGLAIFGGSGLLLYLIAWLVVPADAVATVPVPAAPTDPASPTESEPPSTDEDADSVS